MTTLQVFMILAAMFGLTFGLPGGFGGKHEHHTIHVPYKVHTVHHHHVQKVPVIKEIVKEVPVEKLVIKEIVKEVPVEKVVHIPVEKIVHVPVEKIVHVPVYKYKEIHVPVHVHHKDHGHHEHHDHHSGSAEYILSHDQHKGWSSSGW